MSTISTYTNLIKIFGEELDTSDKEYIKTILINIMSMLEISIVPTEILTMVDEERRHQLLPIMGEVIYFGDEANGQIINTSGHTICNLHQENIDPDVFIPISYELLKDGLSFQDLRDKDEVEDLIATIEQITRRIDLNTLTLARLKVQRMLLNRRVDNITSTYFRNLKMINQAIASNEQLKELLTNTGKERLEVERQIAEIENQSVKGKK